MRPLRTATMRFSLHLLPVALACGMGWGCAVVPTEAHAQFDAPPDGTALSIDLPAQPLGRSLNALARQAGVAIAVDTRLIRHRIAPRIHGSFSLGQALEQLLQGSSLEAQRRPGGGYVVMPAPQAPSPREATLMASLPSGLPMSTLDGVNVFASLEAIVSVGSESAQTLREAPKSISILTGERIEMQDLDTFQEVLMQATGITTGAFSPLSTFYYARGLRLRTFQFDGGAPAQTDALGFYYTPDTATIDRVELLRGIDGMYAGAGDSGGVVNLVRKRPSRARRLRLDLSAGTWDHHRGTLDITGPISQDGRLRGRMVVSHTNRGYVQDRYTSEKRIAYGVVELDFAQTAMLTLGVNREQRQDDGYPGWSGIPRYTDGGALDVPRSYSIAPNWSRYHVDTSEAFLKLDSRYGRTGTLRLSLTRIGQDSEVKQILNFGAVDRATGAGTRFYGSHDSYSVVQELADLSASGLFELFGHSHRYAVGADRAKSDGAGQLAYELVGFTFADNNPLNYATFDPGALAEPTSRLIGSYPVLAQSQHGYYGTVALQLAQSLQLMIGGRYGNFDYRHVYRQEPEGTSSSLRSTAQRFVPSAALSHELSASWTTYLSYGRTFKPQAHLRGPTAAGSPLNPANGYNVELGLKGDMFAGLTASLALFRQAYGGEGLLVPSMPVPIADAANATLCCYIPEGEVRVRGLDAELSGAIMSGWQVFGGYTLSNASFQGASGTAFTLGRTPEHQLKLWSTYRLPGPWSRWTVNGGVIAQSRTRHAGVTYGGMTLWNAAVRFEVDDHWALSLSSDNLTDKVYWQPTGTMGFQNVWGTPRSVTLSLRGRW